MKVLFAAAEGAPFMKTGGLGDVIGSLPKELKKLGLEVGVILPKHLDISEKFKEEMTPVQTLSVPVGWRNKYAGLEKLNYNEVTFYFVDNEYYFKRHGCYGHWDDGERYSFFCRAVVESLPYLDFRPDIIHCHDWHTGMISVLLADRERCGQAGPTIRTVFTIHNLKYQGIFPQTILGDLLGLDDSYFTVDGVEFYDQVNFMKGGINFSDLVTTVSKTYAEEIQHPTYGECLDGLLRKRSGDLFGIVNGIDYEEYNPENDPHIFVPYTQASLAKKAHNTKKLQKLVGLPEAKVPVVGLVSRLVEQKGFDLIGHVLEDLMALDLQLVVLGTGDPKYEEMFSWATGRYPEKMAVTLEYDDSLAHKIYAGADFFLMPSLFEPCGLSQLIAMRYGTIPIVRETGGLKDTVIPFDKHSGQGSGFTFTSYNAYLMLDAVKRAISYYRKSPYWTKLRKQVMELNYSWLESAKVYRSLYHQLVKRNI